MKKFIEVKLTDIRYLIPISVIADNRARRYAEGSTNEQQWKEIYDKIYNVTLNDNYTLLVWAKEAIKWEDIKKFAIEDPILFDIDNHWRTGDHRIINIDDNIHNDDKKENLFLIGG